MNRAAILRTAHHVAKREENATEQDDAQKEAHEVPAFEHPVATAAFSVSRHRLVTFLRAA
jgi:IMP cyclohydrolase